ncbi:DUF4097 family beta strand repeat-containing protein [Actinomadura rubrisoli]|uniref:Uncharacterized protein n=1 Tax=Actinomadura rubrisoli TaxID=2530368 RepID=A0A4R5B550_9ACTN|nr:DUF4097 family beta strand repeat-containing protein [Actinomadura rubrisoli]TDD79969.1 hypothetical protein E1298_26730 [Actinomadura rubrisoli]
MTSYRTVTVVLTCAVLAATATGCLEGGDGGDRTAGRAGNPEDGKKGVDLRKIRGDIKTSKTVYTVDGGTVSLSVDTFGGDISVVAGPGDSKAVKVTEIYRWTKKKPWGEHSLKDGQLTLKAHDCGSGSSTCDLGYQVVLPPRTALNLLTSGGNVSVRETSGTVRATTRGGDIAVRRVRAQDVVAHTGGGAVVVDLLAPPRRVDVTGDGGDITIGLPDGKYAVDAASGGGDTRVTVPVDKSSAHRVRARTAGGAVTVSRAR